MWISRNAERIKMSSFLFRSLGLPSSCGLSTYRPSFFFRVSFFVHYCCIETGPLNGLLLGLFFFLIVFKRLENSWPQKAVSACLSPLPLFKQEAIHIMGGFQITPAAASLMFLLPHSSFPLSLLVYSSTPVFSLFTLPR